MMKPKAPHFSLWLMLTCLLCGSIHLPAAARVKGDAGDPMGPASNQGTLQRLDTSRHADVTSGVGLEEGDAAGAAFEETDFDRLNRLYMVTFEGIPQVPENHPLAEAHYGEAFPVSGDILETRSVRLALADGESDRFLLAQVRLETGKTCVVSLGEEAKLRAVDFQRSDGVEMTAAGGRLSGIRILIAQNVHGEEGTITVNQHVARATRSQHHALTQEAR